MSRGYGLPPAGLYGRRIGPHGRRFSNVILGYAAFLPLVTAIAPEGDFVKELGVLRVPPPSGEA